MKRKVISFLFGLMLIFGVMGCAFEPEESLFLGKWVEPESPYGFSVNTYFEIFEDGTWEEWIGSDWTGGYTLNSSGTWVWNGDKTITLTRTTNFGIEETLATYDTEYDDEIKERKKFLLIDGTKYYKE